MNQESTDKVFWMNLLLEMLIMYAQTNKFGSAILKTWSISIGSTSILLGKIGCTGLPTECTVLERKPARAKKKRGRKNERGKKRKKKERERRKEKKEKKRSYAPVPNLHTISLQLHVRNQVWTWTIFLTKSQLPRKTDTKLRLLYQAWCT